MSSDECIARALNSHHHVVVIEAPAGCGKTFQAAQYAEKLAKRQDKKVLVLTHTHAARQVFTDKQLDKKYVEVRTLDSLSMEIAKIYHKALELPKDVFNWAISNKEGYTEISKRVSALLEQNPYITQSLASRYQVVIADEHQDASKYQHKIVRAIADAGIQVRIFGDPMQQIYSESQVARRTSHQEWEEVIEQADWTGQLENPHRWKENSELGEWILEVRTILKSGQKINLNSAPSAVKIVPGDAEFSSARKYMPAKGVPKQALQAARNSQNIWFLSLYNESVALIYGHLRYKGFSLWEGSTRPTLEKLFQAINKHEGNPIKIGEAAGEFLSNVYTRFSKNAQAPMHQQLADPARKPRRGGAGMIQRMANPILAEPNHFGVSKLFQEFPTILQELPWQGLPKLNYRREFQEACKLGEYSSAFEAMAALTQGRAHRQVALPRRAVSTIHKSKGLEFEEVVVMGLESAFFNDTPRSRALLYTALSRAVKGITLVIPNTDLTPLIQIDRSKLI